MSRGCARPRSTQARQRRPVCDGISRRACRSGCSVASGQRECDRLHAGGAERAQVAQQHRFEVILRHRGRARWRCAGPIGRIQRRPGAGPLRAVVTTSATRGFATGPVTGLAGEAAIGFVELLRTPAESDIPTSPSATFSSDRRLTLIAGLVITVISSVIAGLLYGIVPGLLFGGPQDSRPS